MSFFLQKSGRGRKQTVSARPNSLHPSISSRLPRNIEEIGYLLGGSLPAQWWWSGTDTNYGYFSGIAGATKYVSESGFISSCAKTNIVDGNKATLPAVIVPNITFSGNESFAIVMVVKIGENSGEDFGITARYDASASTLFQCYTSGSGSRFYLYAKTPDGGVSNIASDAYLKNCGLSLMFFGWDKRVRKFWTMLNGSMSLSPDQGVVNFTSSSEMYISRPGGAYSVVCLAKFSGESAESLRDVGASMRTKLIALIPGNGNFTSSCSSVFHQATSGNYNVSWQNTPYSNSDGLLIHPAIVNLFSDFRGMTGWTPSELTAKNWDGIAADGMRTLASIKETTADAEHKTTISFSPLATGRHWFEFTARMETIAGLSLEISNGTDASYVSFDASGNDTDYVVRTPGTVFDTLSTGLYRIKLPLDITTLDAFTITARTISFVANAWVDSYVGVATKTAYLGDWSMTLSKNPPQINAISIGSASTAIAPIVDWVDSGALKRLKADKLSTRVRVSVYKWLETDYCVWTWRKDQNNAVEVWLRYIATVDNRQQYTLKLNVIVAGTATETALNTGIWVLDSTVGDYVRDLSVSISINSLGAVKWWVRGEPVDSAIPIFEDPNYQSGEQTLNSYTAPVVTSVRLGASAAGTGQQPMTVKEVIVW